MSFLAVFVSNIMSHFIMLTVVSVLDIVVYCGIKIILKVVFVFICLG